MNRPSDSQYATLPCSCCAGCIIISRSGWSFSILAAMLSMNLFTYRDLKDWLADPMETLPETVPPDGFQLSLAGVG